MAGPTSRPFAKAFACAGAALLLALAALYGSLGPPSAEGAGEAAGRLVMTVGLPAVIAGWLARRSVAVWPFWKIAFVFVLLLVAVLAILTFGRATHR
jgi:hypothetical protein